MTNTTQWEDSIIHTTIPLKRDKSGRFIGKAKIPQGATVIEAHLTIPAKAWKEEDMTNADPNLQVLADLRCLRAHEGHDGYLDSSGSGKPCSSCAGTGLRCPTLRCGQ